MLTEIDEKKGLVKTSWKHVRDRVSAVEPTFATLVDKLSPDKNYPVYLAYYPYGAVEADTESSFFPDQNGKFYRLTDPETPRDLCKNLGYSKGSAPLGMVLEKELESYIDLGDDKLTIPWIIYTPGKIFPFSSVLRTQSDRAYCPNGLLSSTAGARSVFMLPNIGCFTNHSNLQRDLNIKSQTPRALYEHAPLFKEIVNSKAINSDWRCCVLYFSEKWIKSLHEDSGWLELRQYIHTLAWRQFEYERNRIYYDISFSMIQKKRNLRPNPYLADTARHLFSMAIGNAPGYIPAINDDALPLSIIQKAYVESYNLKKYYPTVMRPVHYSFETDLLPIYYSFQNPSTHIFSPKSRVVTSTLYEMRELENIISIFIEELIKKDTVCSDTIIGRIAENISFNYFHNKADRHSVVKLTDEIITQDERFTSFEHGIAKSGSKFASDSTFVRGCVSISKK